MERWLLIIVGVLLMGAVGAFLLVVPTFSAIGVVVAALGMVLVFILGVQVGARSGSHHRPLDEDAPGAKHA